MLYRYFLLLLNGTCCMYTAISRKVVAKTLHATIPKGNMRYDQYTCSWHCSCRTYFCCFPLAHMSMASLPFFEISLKTSDLKTTHNTFRDCRVHFFRQPFSKQLYKHDRSAAALAKQLRFNHKWLTFNKHDKSAFTMTTNVVNLFLICSRRIHCRCGFVALFLSLPCDDFEYKLPILILNSAINPWVHAFFKRDIIYRFSQG